MSRWVRARCCPDPGRGTSCALLAARLPWATCRSLRRNGLDRWLAGPHRGEIVPSSGVRVYRRRRAEGRGPPPRRARANPAADHVQKQRQPTDPGPAQQQVQQRDLLWSRLAPPAGKNRGSIIVVTCQWDRKAEATMAAGKCAMVAHVGAPRKVDDLIECFYAVIDLARLIFRGRTSIDDGLD